MSEQVTTPPGLPELAETTIDAMEDRIFTRIAHERDAQTSKAARTKRQRSRTMLWAAAAAVVVVAGAAVVPGLMNQGLGTASSVPDMEAGSAPLSARSQSDSSAGGGVGAGDAIAGDGTAPMAAEGATIEPQIITTISTTLTVDSIQDAADKLTAFATDHGGYVATMSIGSGGYDYTEMTDSTAAQPTYGSVVLRLPSTDVEQAVTTLADVGKVTGTTIDRQDVTTQVVDTQAHVEAYEVSVKRLQDIMAQSGSLADLVAAEQALTERQAVLDSYQQQLTALTDQVDLATVSVDLYTRGEAVSAEPAGFLDGLFAGWNGLLAMLNGLIIGLGFLLPWLLVLGAAGVVVWLIVRAIRRRRRATRPAELPEFE